MIKCMIIDWGGVCTESHLIHNYSKKLENELNVSAEKAEEVFIEKDTPYELGQISSDEFWNHFSSRLNVDRDRAREIFVQTQNVKSDVIDYVKSLKVQFHVVLLTNNYFDLLDNIRNNYSETFHMIYSSSELGIKKPDENIYRKVLNDMRLSPSECIFIDDKEKNLVPAKELGMFTIQFKDLDSLKDAIDTIVGHNNKL